jgi:hypothetical protein
MQGTVLPEETLKKEDAKDRDPAEGILLGHNRPQET